MEPVTRTSEGWVEVRVALRELLVLAGVSDVLLEAPVEGTDLP